MQVCDSWHFIKHETVRSSDLPGFTNQFRQLPSREQKASLKWIGSRSVRLPSGRGSKRHHSTGLHLMHASNGCKPVHLNSWAHWWGALLLQCSFKGFSPIALSASISGPWTVLTNQTNHYQGVQSLGGSPTHSASHHPQGLIHQQVRAAILRYSSHLTSISREPWPISKHWILFLLFPRDSSRQISPVPFIIHPHMSYHSELWDSKNPIILSHLCCHHVVPWPPLWSLGGGVFFLNH